MSLSSWQAGFSKLLGTSRIARNLPHMTHVSLPNHCPVPWPAPNATLMPSHLAALRTIAIAPHRPRTTTAAPACCTNTPSMLDRKATTNAFSNRFSFVHPRCPHCTPRPNTPLSDDGDAYGLRALLTVFFSFAPRPSLPSMTT